MRIAVTFAASLFAIVLAAASPAQAQTFGNILGNTVERALKSEVQRKVDQETRRTVRCALGDERCRREAEARGDKVVTDGGSGGASADPGGDHPLITPYRGSVRRLRNYDAYTEYHRIVGRQGRENQTQRLEGTLTRIKYDNPKGRSTFEIERNYRNELTAQGMSIDYECTRRDKCGTTSGPPWTEINGINLGIDPDVRYFTGRLGYNGGTAYVAVAVNTNVTYVHVLETAEMETGMVGVDSSALAAGLERDGKVTLEGIYFDTGKDSLRAESDDTLRQVGLLLMNDPGLRLQIVGHTDSSGSDQLNLALSQRRADAVRAAISSRYGIDNSRLSAVGMGSRQPVASNATAEGRAQNRRVELVKL